MRNLRPLKGAKKRLSRTAFGVRSVRLFIRWHRSFLAQPTGYFL